MVTRRGVLHGLGLAPLALALGWRDAEAAPRPGRLYRARANPPHQGGPLADHYPYARVKVGRAVRHRGATVFSIANRNDRYAAVVALAAVPTDPPMLAVAAGMVPARSWGSGFGDAGGGSVTYEVDRATADELCAAWRITRGDRVPLGDGLVGAWRPRAQPFLRGQPMELVLAVSQTSATPVAMTLGGRQRGARDNRFAFTVSRGGLVLPIIDAPDFGGIMTYRVMARGDQVELVADLRAWATIDQPGRYKVTCRHAVELSPTIAGAPWPDHGHDTWDHTFDATLAIDVE